MRNIRIPFRVVRGGVKWTLPTILASLAIGASQANSAEDLASFYQGKTISFVIGYSAGGGYDTYARLVARHFGGKISGSPTIVPRNMPGASSRVAVAHTYNVAQRDGLTICTGDQSLALAQAMGQSLNFDMSKFSYIGNPSSENNTTVTWHTSGIRSIQDATKQEVTMGATGGSPSSQYPKIMNAVLGTKFRIVLGYPGGNEINLAMERGEVGGRGSNSWASWKATRPEWLSDKKINILVQVGLKKADDLPDVPLLVDLAKNDEDRALLRLFSTPSTVGRPIFTTPETPKSRVDALRSGFDLMIKDPSFLADAKKAGLDIDAVSGVELQEIVEQMLSTPKAITQRLATILAEGENPKK
jgi:tripartite-type tricarboxylate transporter receptor subunit TctC